MRFFRLPGVYVPQEDTALLLEAFSRERVDRGAAVLDVGTGCGVLAVAAARRRARAVAVDASHRAVLTTRLNALRAGVRVRAVRGDLLTPVSGGCFDLILANLPYVPVPVPVPVPGGRSPLHGPGRNWAGGQDGRAFLDRLCRGAPELLRPGGVVLMVHSSVCGPERTVKALEEGGLTAEVTARRAVAYGPVMRGQALWMREQGLIEADDVRDELVVVRGEHLT
ncbi:methyltransferase [Streptomyces rectiverticillatus]|uniref:HemK2/MTQ2 family protein methyltransferase n=1 Tax=Streptomyces rectiverticillatus TaxID=173860 RepID=UPI0015C3C0E3|nr:HemK2/MTQ2 family protein methyltransferase [Streptomyces rectiverticillatus]QLE75597.1 methyltransferase [Streptomyces rectiverticillatus]